MGYRSDVALGIAFPNNAALVSFLTAQKLTGTREMQEAIKQFGVTHMSAGYKEHLVLWVSMEDVKWYPDYPEVMAYNQIIQNAKDLDYSTIEIEIGEETNDIKFEVYQGEKSDSACLYDVFGIQREIVRPESWQDISSFVKEN
jgi:hypothetical protein